MASICKGSGVKRLLLATGEDGGQQATCDGALLYVDCLTQAEADHSQQQTFTVAKHPPELIFVYLCARVQQKKTCLYKQSRASF